MTPKIPPVLVVIVAGLLIWAISRYVPSPSVIVPGKDLVAAVLVAVGAVVVVLGVVSFRRASTTVDPLHPEQASALVVSGVYRVTRNPMYLGFAIVLLAWVFYLSAWPALVVVVAYVAYISRFQIEPEEQALEARFGEAFLDYKQSVRRWL
ncbi:MAG: protein-S-isoprenylcysteine methyltransferase [Xanthomonadales bacterium]|nr:protein-S-isoprenylcysteine methyltransferase [Xanthomonadales bacterium]|tara:strand:+ start:1388 stop:1840 length:453 start_codon:yes stop_codon:yes gene_type:complete